MSTKRKRSTGSLFTTPAVEAPSPTPFFSSPVVLPNFFAQSKGYDPQSPSSGKQSHQQSNTHQEEDSQSQTLHSRTRKRYRDGRPEASQIHGTLTKCPSGPFRTVFILILSVLQHQQSKNSSRRKEHIHTLLRYPHIRKPKIYHKMRQRKDQRYILSGSYRKLLNYKSNTAPRLRCRNKRW
ncbi:hypothetical protein KCU95_g3545, partial [Aureobasidium melanogenum]